MSMVVVIGVISVVISMIVCRMPRWSRQRCRANGDLLSLCAHVYIYIYIERERDICIYIYIHIYYSVLNYLIHVCIYIYIYIQCVYIYIYKVPGSLLHVSSSFWLTL